MRLGETITLTDKVGAQINGGYLTDENGCCRFNFRTDMYSGRAGIKGRGKGHRDAKDAALNTGILEPSIGLRKQNPLTNEWIDDSLTPGEWVAVNVTFPLREPCLMGSGPINNRISLPGELCVFDKQMTRRERARRDGQN